MYRMLPLILVSLLTVPSLATVPAAKIRGAVTKTIGASDVKALDAVLAAHGLDVNSLILEKGDTFLHYAVGEGSLEMVEHLINNGARVNVANRYGYTPLDEAKTFGNTDIVALLEEAGATQGKVFSIKVAPTAEGDAAPLNPPVLLTAARMGQTETIVLLLDRGANIEAENDIGWTALMLAALNGNTETVRLLLDKGADIEAKDNKGRTALMLAVRMGRIEIVTLLLDRGANIEAKDNKGRTALIFAALSGKTEIAMLLLKRGADIEAKDNKGRTALRWAARMRETKTVDLLRERGAKH